MRRAILVLLVALSSSACGSSGGGEAPEFITIQGAASFPHESVMDWVSYAEQVSVVTILSEGEVADPTIATNGEGYVGRELRAKINRTLWHADGLTPAGGEFSFVTAGWSVQSDGTRVPALFEDAPTLTVGRSYLMPLTPIDDVLGPLAPAAIAEVVSGRIRVPGVPPIEILGVIDEDRLAEVENLLLNADPDPVAVKYWHLPPYERARAVVDEKASR